jgi:integrase/ribosomal protein L40E
MATTIQTTPIETPFNDDEILSLIETDARNLGKTESTIHSMMKLIRRFQRFRATSLIERTDDDYYKFLRTASTPAVHNMILCRMNLLRATIHGTTDGSANLVSHYKKLPAHEDIDLEIEDENLQKLLRACRNTLQETLVYILRYGGLRIEEAAKLQKKHVKVHVTHVQLVGFERKRTRSSQVVRGDVSIAVGSIVIARYVATLPGAPSYLFANKDGSGRMPTSSLYMLYKRIAKRAKLEHVNPHYQRHICATNMAASGMSERIMCPVMGWTPGSNMPSTYINVESKLANAQYLAMQGVKVEESRQESIKICPACHASNPKIAVACNACGTPFDSATQEEIKQTSNKITELEAQLAPLLENSEKITEFFGNKKSDKMPGLPNIFR